MHSPPGLSPASSPVHAPTRARRLPATRHPLPPPTRHALGPTLGATARRPNPPDHTYEHASSADVNPLGHGQSPYDTLVERANYSNR